MHATSSGEPAAFDRARPAILAFPEAGDSIRCLACAHRCLIRPGRSGICHVRQNRAGELVTLDYGECVAANSDPVEKKPLYHFYPGSVAYSIATAGCNMHCAHCQNWAISQAPRDNLEVAATHVEPREVVGAAIAAGARSVAYTYTEPTVFIEWVLDTARLARRDGLANVLVTNGYETPEAIELLAPVIDAANVDLKSFDDSFYRLVCGARLAPVLDALVEMRRKHIWLEVTTLIIPTLNDDPDRLAALAEWIVTALGPETPWHVSRFFPTYRLGHLPPTPRETVARAVAIGQAAGLRHVYAGNVDGIHDDTLCSGCGETLIWRRGFHAVRATALEGGRCTKCGTQLAGVGLSEWDPIGGLARGSAGGRR
jgi:pyruvate formate lyase activating enzyme